MMNQSILQTDALTRKFGRTVAVDALTLDVPQGSTFALVGANGAGKTTLIKLLMNILQPQVGSSHVLGVDSRHLRGAAFERIGYISENQELPDGMTVGSMLNYFRPFYPQWDRALEAQLLRQFDLPIERKLKHLSRGMKMKASFVSSLAYRPELLILDEPFSGLDPLVRDELIEGLLERSPETTIFLSSHDLAEIESFASHIAYLENGCLLFAEEMNVLSDRFREVTVTLDSPAQPAQWPASWMQVQSVDCVLRFVHNAYNESTTRGEILQCLPQARTIDFDPMSLRAIFLAVAKSKRAQQPVAAQQQILQESEA